MAQRQPQANKRTNSPQSLLLKKKMLIRDCSNYKGLESGYYRIAVKKQEENDRLIAALEEVLSDENIK